MLLPRGMKERERKVKFEESSSCVEEEEEEAKGEVDAGRELKESTAWE